MRPSGAILAELSRLVAEACRIAALTRDVVARPEAMRALELHILDATVECLTTGKGNDVRSRPAEIAAAYELALETCGADARMPVILAFMGSTERILESACAACFGMSPNAYRRLRRLNRVRSALGHATATTTIAEIATSFGVSELGRFAGEYRKAFGEPPSHTLRSARSRCL
jgi:methylphosphotriester-DNA--protein-cysteine methyltransferase